MSNNYLNELIKFIPPDQEDDFGQPILNEENIVYVKGNAVLKTKYVLDSNNQEKLIKELSIIIPSTALVDKKWRVEYEGVIYLVNQVDRPKHPFSGRVIHKVVSAI
ncbi:hypothetical protein KK120_18625 [Virgibacillus dakarensis]|nr:hypothetical protein [Virgibacillus dakarensis]